MRHVLFAAAILLSACDSAPPPPKIAEPQREALDKARAVEQAVQSEAEASKQAIEKATE